VTFGLKHLATPTLVWGASYTRVESEDRPRLDAYAANIRKYLPEVSSAIHGSAARLINTGEVSTNTSIGSLAGVQAELAFLKELWKGAASRISYRYVREDEETRAFGDHIIYGSDNYSAGFTQDLKRGTISQYPTTVNVAVTRSISNSETHATSGEAGLGMKF
jgi:hypothetical protein